MKIKDGSTTFLRQSMNNINFHLTTVHDEFLTIKDACENDAGIYRCIAVSNNLEVHSDDINLCIFGGKLSKHFISDVLTTTNNTYRKIFEWNGDVHIILFPFQTSLYIHIYQV